MPTCLQSRPTRVRNATNFNFNVSANQKIIIAKINKAIVLHSVASTDDRVAPSYYAMISPILILVASLCIQYAHSFSSPAVVSPIYESIQRSTFLDTNGEEVKLLSSTDSNNKKKLVLIGQNKANPPKPPDPDSVDIRMELRWI